MSNYTMMNKETYTTSITISTEKKTKNDRSWFVAKFTDITDLGEDLKDWAQEAYQAFMSLDFVGKSIEDAQEASEQ